MKIVHCFFTLKTGGSQILAVDMLNVLGRSHDVALIIVNDQWSETLLQQLHPRVAVYRINRNVGSRNPFPVLRFNYLLATLKPDVIHCHERDLVRLIWYRRPNVLLTIHDVGVPTATFSRYDALVAISDAVAQDVYQRSGLRATVIKNGIPFDHFRQRTDHRFRPGSPFRVVQVSRLMHEKKGQDVLIRAVAKMQNDHPELDVTVDFVGDGASADYLRDLARSLTVEARIRFRGEQSRTWLREHLAGYHALVQPSRYEGFGLTIVEGFAANLPVLAADIEGPAEILRGLPAGFRFERENVTACADALRTLYRAYERGQLGEAVRQTRCLVESRFSVETVVANYLRVYQQLVPTRPAAVPRARVSQPV